MKLKSKIIIWEQPDKNKEVYFGLVDWRVFFTIEKKGYKFHCSSSKLALIGIYDDWDKDLEALKRKAGIALEKNGVVNHILN